MVNQMTRIALRAAAFAFGLGVVLPIWAQAQVTPSINQAATREVEFPRYVMGGAVQLFDLSGNVLGTASHPVLIACPDGTTNCFTGGGGSITGTVGIDQTTDGTTNAVHLKAGTALAGKFGIDQTTDGTTNAVHLTAGSNLAGKFGIDQTTPGTTNAVQANAGTNLNTSLLALEAGGNLATIANSLGGCAGQTVANTTVTPINNAGSASNLKLVSKASSKNVYICAIDITAGAATNIALVEGTQTTNACDTSTAGMAGGATAATGWNFAANGGIAKGIGTGIVYRTATTNHDVCLFFSAGNQVSGAVTWAQF